MGNLAHAGLGALVIAFFGGILSFFSPCVAPLVPGYISYLSGAALREDDHDGNASPAGDPPPARAGGLRGRGPVGAGGARPAVSTASLRSVRAEVGMRTAQGRGATTLQMRRASMVAHAGGGGISVGTLAAQTGIPVVAPRRLSTTSAVSLLFVGGFSTAFVALGMLAGTFGQVVAAYRPVMQTLAEIVMVTMGAFLLQWLPRSWMDWLTHEGRLHPRPGTLRGWGLAAPYLFGVVFAAGWTPCIGPVLAAILAAAGASGSTFSGVVLLAFYSLGFAVPFLAVGLGWSAGLGMLGWVKRHNHLISTVSGVALLAVGMLYLTGEVSIFSTWAGHLPIP